MKKDKELPLSFELDIENEVEFLIQNFRMDGLKTSDMSQYELKELIEEYEQRIIVNDIEKYSNLENSYIDISYVINNTNKRLEIMSEEDDYNENTERYSRVLL